jgi:hypothetical protein
VCALFGGAGYSRKYGIGYFAALLFAMIRMRFVRWYGCRLFDFILSFLLLHCLKEKIMFYWHITLLLLRLDAVHRTFFSGI